MKKSKEQKTELIQSTLDHIHQQMYPISVVLFYVETNGYVSYDYDIIADTNKVKNYKDWEIEIRNKIKDLSYSTDDCNIQHVGYICCNFEKVSYILENITTLEGYNGDMNIFKELS